MRSNEQSISAEVSPQITHRALIEKYGRYVYAIVFNKLRSCGSNEDIDECVSDIFADIFLKAENISEAKDDLKALIGTVARNTAIDRWRSLSAKNSRTVYIDEENIAELASDIDIEESFTDSELRQILLNKIEELGEPDSTIIIQKFYYGLTSAQIAKAVSMTASSVRSRCTRAMSKLKAMLAQEGITR